MAVGSRPLVPSRLAPGGVAHGSRHTSTTLVGAYVALTKPRIIELLLITTVPTMVLAAGGLAVDGARRRDADRRHARRRRRQRVQHVRRSRHRPADGAHQEPTAGDRRASSRVTRWCSPRRSRSSRSPCCGGAPTCCRRCSPCRRPPSTCCVYTIWLKRTSRQNIVIGGAAGAVPVLVGWAAVRNDLGWAPVVLFAAMFFWTPPHFWALAIKYADDYRAADVPMLPGRGAARRRRAPDDRLHGRARRVDTGADPGRRPRTDLRRRPRSCSASIFLGATVWLGEVTEPAGEHARVRATRSPT